MATSRTSAVSGLATVKSAENVENIQIDSMAEIKDGIRLSLRAGSSLWRELQRRGLRHLIGRSRAELDLLDDAAVHLCDRNNFRARADMGSVPARKWG